MEREVRLRSQLCGSPFALPVTDSLDGSQSVFALLFNPDSSFSPLAGVTCLEMTSHSDASLRNYSFRSVAPSSAHWLDTL